MDIIQQLDKEQVEKLSAGKNIPDFQPGDTVLVNVKVVEGDKTKLMAVKVDVHPLDAALFAIPKSYKNLAAR